MWYSTILDDPWCQKKKKKKKKKEVPKKKKKAKRKKDKGSGKNKDDDDDDEDDEFDKALAKAGLLNKPSNRPSSAASLTNGFDGRKSYELFLAI